MQYNICWAHTRHKKMKKTPIKTITNSFPSGEPFHPTRNQRPERAAFSSPIFLGSWLVAFMA